MKQLVCMMTLLNIGKQCILIPEAPLCGVSKGLISVKNE